jgi:Phage integrase, N-terminal SAM-like domain
VRTNATFAVERLRRVGHDWQRKPSTLAGYRAIVRSQLLPAFGELPLESITTAMIERWLAARPPPRPAQNPVSVGDSSSKAPMNHERTVFLCGRRTGFLCGRSWENGRNRFGGLRAAR